ncbi:hypothetical protein CVU37_08235 [candidate division BRC1 bacterium HGW-BRC1-1]|jgi:two-component system response regulator AtoC|nr:MAG: hypothetical protein CVU37_08235 [candidate division BRC1 bacterium HGW-BRC1-1]
MASIVIVDDEIAVRNLITKVLTMGGHEVRSAGSLEEFRSILEAVNVEIVLLDVHLPDGRGDEAVPDLLARDAHLRVIMITGDSSLETVESAIRNGAFDYLTKPFNTEALRHVVSQAGADRLRAITQSVDERNPVRSVTSQRRLAGFSRQVCSVNLAIDRMAKLPDTPVLIEGESGTGKEMAARAVHELSERSKMPFVTVNCAAIPKPVMDGELFGHEHGAQAAHPETRKGYLELADGGTLFLDELNEMPEHLQDKLAAAMTDGVVIRLGAQCARPINVRVLAAINTGTRNSEDGNGLTMAIKNHFADNNIAMPPLRKHPDDIEHLAYIFLREKSLELNKKVYGFTDGILNFFRDYSWPGNVRELKNVVERLVMLTSPGAAMIDEECLQSFCFQTGNDLELNPALQNGGGGNRRVALRDFGGDHDELIPLEESERNYLRKALQILDFNKTQCAAQLGISRSTLQRKIRQYGLE